jgi:citrate synthase
MKLEIVGVENVLIDSVLPNLYSANEEDSSTYNRLKKELSEIGLIEYPVVILDDSGYRYLAGTHRGKAWRELGNEYMPCVVLKGELTAEEEFNLVNNLNQVRGGINLSGIKRVIRSTSLDVTKLDLFKIPVTSLVPKVNDVNDENNDLQYRARLRDLALKLANELAEILLNNKEEDLIAFHKDGKAVAIIKSTITTAAVRSNISIFKNVLRQAINAMEDKPI